MSDLLAGEPVPVASQIKCVEREIAMRRSVYPRRVAARKMTQAKADAEIAAMVAVLETLKTTAALRDIGDRICAIMNTYDEQAASPRGVDTPGGLEHMGDVWGLLDGWRASLRRT